MIRALIAVFVFGAVLTLPASAQLTTTFVGPGSSGGGGGALTPCTAGAIDLSLTTGCNIPQFMDGVIP